MQLSASCVRRTLHQQDYTVQRPVLTVSSPDPEYEQKRSTLEDLQRRAQAGEIDLYYEDEVDLALLPGVLRCWSKRGCQRKIETPRQNKKQYGAGLIHWGSGKQALLGSQRAQGQRLVSLGAYAVAPRDSSVC